MVTELDRLRVLLQQELSMQKYFMGISQEKEISLEDTIPTLTMIPGPASEPGNHIDIRLIEKQKELVKTNIRLDQAGYYPNLTMFASVNYMNQSNTMYLFGKPTDWFNTSLFGLRLNVPVFNGLQRHYKVKQTRIELEKLNLTEHDTREYIRINSADAARKLLNAIEAEKQQRANVVLADRVYNITQEQYQTGVIPLTDLLTAETALSGAQANHTYALVQMKLSELSYLKANGRIMEIVK
jgi:outer membrane protein TolC